MVALNPAYASSKPLEWSQNRVGDFFREGTDRLGTNRLPTRNRTGENGPTVTIIVSGRSSWLSRDPIAENGGINLYGYVYNNPINYWDPLGLSAWYNPFSWSSADWAAFGRGASQGAAAYADGLIPIFDPFSDRYNPCDKSLKVSKFLGVAVREIGVSLAGGVFARSVVASSGYGAMRTYVSFNPIAKAVVNRGILAFGFAASGKLGVVQSAASTLLQGISLYDTYTQTKEFFDD